MTTLREIEDFCHKYAIPFAHFIEVISDLKVIPMLRGKGFEFMVCDMLQEQLDPEVWKVTKFNVNPQRNTTDADLVATYLPHNIEVILECKTAVRESFKSGRRQRTCSVPNFRVKCHKSRSNNERELTNDRYFADEFDVIISNPANAFIKSGDEFELITDEVGLDILTRLYGTETLEEVFPIVSRDLRACLTTSIEEADHTIPRSPIVQMEGDPNWVGLNGIEALFMSVVRRKMAEATRRPTRPAHHT